MNHHFPSIGQLHFICVVQLLHNFVRIFVVTVCNIYSIISLSRVILIDTWITFSLITPKCITWPIKDFTVSFAALHIAIRTSQLCPAVVLFNQRRGESLHSAPYRLLAYLSGFHPSVSLFSFFFLCHLFFASLDEKRKTRDRIYTDL